jgi:acyl-homoserine lactone synthase
LVSALVRDALMRGVSTYTGVAEMSWLQQILAFGWRCRPLGLPRRTDSGMLGALTIEIDAETPSLLTTNGIWTEEASSDTQVLEAA